jgi:hypothetical protein
MMAALHLPPAFDPLPVNSAVPLPLLLQMKSYPRDWLVPGRVRVKLRNDDGSPCNSEVPSREFAL